MLDVHGRLFGFEKEFARASDAKAVIGRLGGFADFDCVLADDIFVCFGATLLVIDVPAEGLKEQIEELAAELGFVVLWRAVSVLVALETFDEIKNFL